MKTIKRTTILVLLLIGMSVTAQNTWRAVYQFKEIQSEESKKREDSIIKKNPGMAKMFKQVRERFSNLTYFLDFNMNESVFKEEEKLNTDKYSSGGMTIVFGANEEILYKNLKKNQYIKTSSMFDGAYRIVDSLPNYHWKITKETKQIGNYLVIKAEGTKMLKDGVTGDKHPVKITAWFTPQIPVGTGPELYGGLPGLIMELQFDNEIFLVKEVVLNPKKHQKIVAPDKGEAISKEEFDIKQKAYIQKMKKMYKNNRSKKGKTSRTFTF